MRLRDYILLQEGTSVGRAQHEENMRIGRSQARTVARSQPIGSTRWLMPVPI
jgi:hypothetical protein